MPLHVTRPSATRELTLTLAEGKPPVRVRVDSGVPLFDVARSFADQQQVFRELGVVFADALHDAAVNNPEWFAE